MSPSSPRILGIAQSGVSRHLGLLKDAGLVEERATADSPTSASAPPVLRRSQRLRARVAAPARAIRRRRRDRRRAAPTQRGSRKCAACARRTSTSTAPAKNGARSCPAGAGPHGRRALGHLLPPHGHRGPRLRRRLPDASKRAALRSEVIAIDRSEAVLARARDDLARRRRRRRTSTGSAASWRSCRSRTPASTWRCSRRRCTTRRIRQRRWPKPCASCVRAAACCSSICGVTTSTGSASGSAIDGWDSTTTNCNGSSKAQDWRR